MQTFGSIIHGVYRYKGAIFFTGLVGVAPAVFLSIRPSPALSTVRWLPHFISQWADRHGWFCNFPAYGALAVPFLVITPNIVGRACVVASLAALVAALEIIQLWIPTRSADLWDIFWGWSGLLTAWAIFEIVNRLGLSLFNLLPKHESF